MNLLFFQRFIGKLKILPHLIIFMVLISFTMGFAKMAKFEPPNGKALLALGQCLEGVGGMKAYGKHPALRQGYIDKVVGGNSNLFPGGITFYTNVIFNLGLTWDGTFEGNDFAGIIHGRRYLYHNEFNKSVFVIGLDLQNQSYNGQVLPQLGPIANGELDHMVKQLAGFVKRCNRPVFLRIGYEFNGHWNGYDPGTYVRAYKRIVDIFRSLDIQNCAFVWQSADEGEAGGNISPYYPGDAYVDWCGFSWFTGNSPAMVNFAKQHDKPVMIAEATTKFHSTSQTGGNDLWNGYFNVVISAMKNSSNRIKALCYINQNWEAQPIWQGSFKDSRIGVNNVLKQKWVDEIKKPFWLHASDNLFATLYNPEGKVDAQFTNDKIRCYTGGSIKYESKSYGNISSYEWNFGSGASPATATGKGPHNVKYTTTGDKTVSLKVTGSGGSDTKEKKNIIKVTQFPSAGWLFSEEFKSGSSVNFAGPKPPWQWVFSHVENDVFRSFGADGHDDFSRNWYLTHSGGKAVTLNLNDPRIKPVIKVRARKQPTQVGVNDKVCLTAGLADEFTVYSDTKMNRKNRLPLTTDWQELTVDMTGELKNVWGTDKHDFAIFGDGPLATDLIGKMGIGLNYDWYNYPDTVNGIIYDYFFQGNVDIDYIKIGEVGVNAIQDELANQSLGSFNALLNKAQGLVTIDLSKQTAYKNISVSLFDLLGKEIKLQRDATAANKLQYHIGSVSNGMYVLKVTMDNVTMNKPFVMAK